MNARQFYVHSFMVGVWSTILIGGMIWVIWYLATRLP